MKKIALLIVIVAIVLSSASCDGDLSGLINRIPYEIELWHEHSWNNWQPTYDEKNLTLFCEVCEAEVKSYPISEGLEIDENGVLLGKGSCTDEYIAVPHGVTTVGEESFSNDKDIKAVFLPNTVTKIENRAFKNCDGLQVINIPEGVTELGDDSFFACKALVGVVIPSSVTYVGEMAFSNCGLLEIIYYVGYEADWEKVEKGKDWDKGAGKHVVDFKFKIGEDVIPHVHHFGDWEILKEASLNEEGKRVRYCTDCDYVESDIIPIVLPDNPDPDPDVVPELEYRINEDGTSYSVVGIGTYTALDLIIPAEREGLPVTAIGADAFINSNFETVTIPDSVASIGDQAFMNSVSICSLNLGKGVKSIGFNSFIGCSALMEVSFPDGLEFLGESSFEDCISLQNITLPDSLEVIGKNAFKECFSIACIDMGNGVKTVGYGAFRNCTVLTTIKFSPVLEFLDEYAFDRCPSIESLAFPDTLHTVSKNAFRECTAIHTIDMGNGVKTIGYGAFRSCTSLSDLKVSESLEFMDEYVFDRCESLVNVVLYDKLTHIGDRAFRYCSVLESINIPDSVTYMGVNLFKECFALKSIVIPESVTEISDYLLSKCSSLESVEIRGEVTRIGSFAFQECYSLKSIVLPDTVTFLGECAFLSAGLESITFGPNITDFDIYALARCGELKTINYGGTMEQWNNVVKGGGWDMYTGTYTIYCIDGKIKYDDSVV